MRTVRKLEALSDMGISLGERCARCCDCEVMLEDKGAIAMISIGLLVLLCLVVSTQLIQLK